MKKRLAIAAVAALGTGVFAAGMSQAASSPTIKLLSAKEVTVAGKPQVRVTVAVTNFKFLPKQIGSTKNVKGAGHFHIYINGTNFGKNYAGADAAKTATTSPAPPGQKGDALIKKGKTVSVRVILANNDHSQIGSFTKAISVKIT